MPSCCSQPGCDKEVHALNVCHTHYVKEKSKTAPECSEQNCQKASRARGMCTLHYDRQLRSESLDKIDYDDFWEFVKKERRIGQPNAKKI